MEARHRAVAAAGGAAVAVLLLGLWLVAGGDDGPRPGTGTGPKPTTAVTEVGKRPPGPGLTPPPRTTTAPTPPTAATEAGPTPVGPPARSAGALRGLVVDEARRPIAGAEVQAGGVPGEQVTPLLALTDQDGRFALETLPPTPILEVAARGFARKVVPLDGASAQVEVVLLPGRRLAGRVVAAEDGAGLEGAVIEGESATWHGKVHSGAGGAFAFEDAAAGEELALVAWAEGRVSKVTDEGGLDPIALERGRRLHGRVLLPDGAPAAGAQVFVTAASQLMRPQRTLAGADGRFEVFGLGADDGARVAAVHAAGGTPAATPLDGPWLEPSLTGGDGAEGDGLTVALTWTRPVEVRGGAAGKADADVALRALDPPPWSPAGRLDGTPSRTGGRLFQDVVPGTYVLEQGGQRVGDELVVPAGEGAFLVPWPGTKLEPPKGEVRPRGPLRVRVEDEARRPVEGATVIVAGVGREAARRSLVTGADGTVVVDPAPAGGLVLTASGDGRILVTPGALGEADAPDEVTLRLVKPVTLEGRVAFPPGVKGPAEVRVATPDDDVLRSGRTRDDGGFRLPDLPPGPVVVEVTAEGCTPASLTLELPSTAPITVTLVPEGELHEHHEGDGHKH
jgi:hypothetical protein